MKFKSTRGQAPTISLSEALLLGLAPDGGLYVPEKFPSFEIKDFEGVTSLSETGIRLLTPFADEGPLKKSLHQICTKAFNFLTPLEKIDGTTSILELDHGPTAAFKDVGARFLAEALAILGGTRARTIIVATSGDTGGAVAAAFFGKPHVKVIILYPRGMVSSFQEKQLTCWGGNIFTFRVRGTFDDCQRLAKETFLDPRWKKENLMSANSINIGRILPQTVYYAWASLQYFQKSGGKVAGFIVPTGNLGNALAALWAKKMGFPIGRIVLACNANRAIVDYFQTGKWNPRPTVTTVANAMDVGNPSNMERLLHLYPDFENLKKDVEAFSVSDQQIKETIKNYKASWNRALCPHTATAAFVRAKLASGPWILVSTAHPAKFKSIVEPLIGEPVENPPSLELFEKRESKWEEIDPTLGALTSAYSSETAQTSP